jgi:hypothetical protein
MFTVLAEGITAAEDALKNDKCKEFLGEGASAKLASIKAKGGISFGTSYRTTDRSGNLTTVPFGNEAGRATQIPDPSNPSNRLQIITFNTAGSYFTMLDVNGLRLKDYVMFEGLTDTQIRGALVLHELAHHMGKTHGESGSENDAFTKEVVDHCFK